VDIHLDDADQFDARQYWDITEIFCGYGIEPKDFWKSTVIG
jgi:hypothetical protein